MKNLIFMLILVMFISGCTGPSLTNNNKNSPTTSVTPSTFPQTTSTIVLTPPKGVVLPIDLQDCQSDSDCVKKLTSIF